MRIIIEDVTPHDIKGFADVISGNSRAPLPLPFYEEHPLPLPVQAQRLLLPGPELPAPHPGVMPSYLPQPTTVAAVPIRIPKPGIKQIAIALLLKQRRQLAIAGLACAGGVFLLFAGSFVIRQVKTGPVEVGPVEAIGGGEVKGETPAEPPAEPEMKPPGFNPFSNIPN